MKYENLLVDKVGVTTTVTLNRPERLNALSPQLLVEFRDVLAEIRADTQCRFVIFTGAGRAFSAGIELSLDAYKLKKSMPGLNSERLWQFFSQDIMNAMENLDQVTVGAVNGVAVGGGLCLLLNCDFRIASDQATFIIPETKLGIPLTWGATPRLVNLIGPSKTKELIMTCDRIDASEAYRIGLVNKVVPSGSLLASSQELVDKIATRGPLAIRMCKKQVNAASTARMANLYLFEADLMEFCTVAGDSTEGMMSFVEKRHPVFPSAKGNTGPKPA
jgi:enoyl-CoA hydratase/carnithine racemase